MSIHNRLVKLERNAIHNTAPTTAREMSDAQLWRIVERSPEGRKLRDRSAAEIDAALARIAGVDA